MSEQSAGQSGVLGLLSALITKIRYFSAFPEFERWPTLATVCLLPHA